MRLSNRRRLRRQGSHQKTVGGNLRVVTRIIQHSSRADTFKITPVGDVHWGGDDCDEILMRRVVKKIATEENHYVIGTGDYIEAIVPGDPRMDFSTLRKVFTPKQIQDLMWTQKEGFAQLVKPIRERFLGLGTGNHEKKLFKKSFFDVHSRICEDMSNGFGSGRELDLGYSCLMKLRFIRATPKGHTSRLLKIYFHHGFGGGKQLGSKVNNVDSLIRKFPYADVYIFAHVHERESHIVDVLDCHDRKDTLLVRHKAMIISGPFKRTYQQDSTSYGEEAGYNPTPLGVNTLIIQPGYNDKRRGEEEIRLELRESTDGLPC